MNRHPVFLWIALLFLAACAPLQAAPSLLPGTDSVSITPASPSAPTGTAVPPSHTPSLTPPPETLQPTAVVVPTVASLKARVTAERLSCRYGPGPEYLYLYGLRRDANIVLIGRTDGNNWVWVEGRNRCWLNPKFIEIEGDPALLPITYPEPAHLPRSPYYAAPVITSAVRNGDTVTVDWVEIPLRAGDEEDESMLLYMIETWRCQDGRLIFDPLATNETSISFIDEQGCTRPSHGRVFFQEKHGFAGPAEIPWP